ncbi:TonB family protein [Sphingobium limneticum]|jgi:protein TonB|uniref:energy transducer TonB family protein n=1 Tax=Sphingobium limneticum TaxID=1007511 RepID=UPI003D027950
MTRIESRYCDRPADWRTRLLGVSGTGAIFALTLGCAMLSWHLTPMLASPNEPLVVTLQPLAAPPEPVEEVPDGPRQIERKVQKPQEQRTQPTDLHILHPTQSVMNVPTPTEQAKAAETVPETTAPQSRPAPPDRQVNSNQEATWEAQLLAHLEKYRRYPPAAKSRRDEGITYVTFRMSRTGTLLSSRIMRSSGSVLLDRAALDMLKRAQPLPAIPADKKDPLELSVPVEFFVTRS